MEFNNIIQKLCGNSTYFKVVSILFKHEEGISGRSLAKLTGVSTFKMHHVLKFLTAQGMLMQSIVGKSYLYKVDKEHILIKKVLLELINFQESLFKELGSKIINHLNPKPLSIILYGSMARGDEDPNSDIDLFFIYKDNVKLSDLNENDLHMESITRKYGNMVTIKKANVTDVNKRYKSRDSLIKNILEEGKVIAGISVIDLLTLDK